MTTSGAELLSVVVPCLNEERNAARFEAELIAPLDALGVPYEVVAVDDGSCDGTFPALAVLASRHRNVRAMRHPLNRGLGAALRTAFEASQGAWIATIDADLTFRPSQIASLLERQLETGADMVAGSPFLAPTGLSQVAWARRAPSAAVNAVYRALFSGSLTAYTPIFRLYRASCLKALPLRSTGFEISAELAVRFLLAGRRVAETPVLLTRRRHGRSKLNPVRELARHAALIARLKLLRHSPA